ncbi:hypothetical protein ASZ78_001234 [Callipepla squamata]|uniref:Uncharacterized protein n=1 Tax=Callipepla squamata TaxID=9009 RepID=A0A226N148_CALSU|nr:hypothetical protein ASZ78_001234 [Callipepla squamata]
MHKKEINLDHNPMRKCFPCSDSSSVKILAVVVLVDCFHFCGEAILARRRSYLGRWLLHGSLIKSFLDKHSCPARCSLPEDAGNYFNEETNVLEAPVTIWIAGNTKPINFTVHAIVTTSDLEISPAEINFGYCTIYEAVWTSVTLTNKSILPWEFGFVGLPEFVEVQPNDGLGVLLPLESLTLHVIFKASKAEEYSFELTCKSEVNRYVKKLLEQYLVQKSISQLTSTIHISLSSEEIPATVTR